MKRIGATLALFLPLTPVAANGVWEDLVALDARVEAAAGAAIGSPGGPVAPIDRRLKLAACPESALIEPAVGGAVAVRCPAKGWRIRVPLSVVATGTMLAGAPSIRRGDVVDLEYEGEGFSASASGVALNDAAAGQAVRVKTSTSAAVTAVVSGNGRAKILP